MKLNKASILVLNMKRIRIGYCGRESKWQSFHWNEFVEYALKRNVEVIRIDLTQRIEDQGKFVLIIHKMTNVMDGHNMECNLELNSLYKYSKDHPEVIIIDKLDNVATSLDREEMTEILQSIQWTLNDQVSIPKSVLLERSDLDNIINSTKTLNFPIIAKPKIASVSLKSTNSFSHMLKLVAKPEDLVNFTTPSVLQEYINHGGHVFKLYALGSQLFCDIRPSTRNVSAGEVINIEFHSEKPNVDNGLWTKPADYTGIQIPMEDFKKISEDIQKAMNLHLLGIDIIIDEENGKYYVIDVNYFPGYKNVKDIWPKFFDFLLECIEFHGSKEQ